MNRLIFAENNFKEDRVNWVILDPMQAIFISFSFKNMNTMIF